MALIRSKQLRVGILTNPAPRPAGEDPRDGAVVVYTVPTGRVGVLRECTFYAPGLESGGYLQLYVVTPEDLYVVVAYLPGTSAVNRTFHVLSQLVLNEGDSLYLYSSAGGDTHYTFSGAELRSPA